MMMLLRVFTIVGIMFSQNIMEIKDNDKINETMNREEANVDAFLRYPKNYTFLCTKTSRGEVLSATLSPLGKMVIEYISHWEDGDHSGRVSGFYDKESNLFKGIYDTNDGRFSGEINFSFNQKGEANGTWDNGYGTIRIHLKK